MFKTQDYPQNVPSATQGEAVSVAAPGLVGAGGTNCPHCGRTLIPSADVFDRIAGFPFEKCSCQLEDTIYRPIFEYLDWLYAELARLDGMPSSPEYKSYRECQAALRVYLRFVAYRLEQGA